MAVKIKYKPIAIRQEANIFFMIDIHFPDLGRPTRKELNVPAKIKTRPMP